MTDVNESDVYRHAATVIVRDGKVVGGLTEQGEDDDKLIDRSLAVCAIGACHRAHYELYGELPVNTNPDLTWAYEFRAIPPPGMYKIAPDEPRLIWAINDNRATTAEDIALILKKQALDVEGG